MIKKILLSASLCYFTNVAFSAQPIPSSFSVKQSTTCPKAKNCVLIVDNAHETIGTLRSDAHHYNLFHYFDNSNQLQLTIRKTRRQRVGPIDSEDVQTDFDVYDTKNALVAKIEFHQDIMALAYQQFFIKTSDGHNVLVHSEPYLGRLGTKTGIYDNYLNMEVAQITRPLFTFSLDSKVVITHQSPLLASIHANIFAATMALYSNKT